MVRSVMMSRMVTQHLEDYHNRTVPDPEDIVSELERQIAKDWRQVLSMR